MDNNLENYRKLGKKVFPEDVGLRLDSYLAKRFLFYSRTAWAKIIKKKVLVNNSQKKPAYKIRSYDSVFYHNPQSEEPNVDSRIKILWEKEDILVTYKPSNLPMHEGGVYRKNTFCEFLKEKVGPGWAPVHRLDKETSGIVVCAKTKDLRAYLSQLFLEQKIEKTYYAIVMGSPQKNSWWVNQPIKQVSTDNIRTKQCVAKNGQNSLTHFLVKDRKKEFALVEVKPKTGRTHQIRVHAAWSGFPLVGDKRYCKDESIFSEYMDFGFTNKVKEHCLEERLCLHATKIQFVNPYTNENQEITSEIPQDMKDIWNRI